MHIEVDEEMLQGVYNRESKPHAIAAIIRDGNIIWPDDSANEYSLHENQIFIVYEDAPFHADIELNDRQLKLTWSDGDIWTREVSKEEVRILSL